MDGFFSNIEQDTLKNNFFRKVIFTGEHAQLVLMSLNQGEEIGQEVHEGVDQFFRVEAGEAKVIINNEEFIAKDGDAFIVPAGANHNVINNGDETLKLYTIYSPPNHAPETIHETKEEADIAEEHEHSKD